MEYDRYKLSIEAAETDKIMGEAAEYLWRRLTEKLGEGKKILLLLSGGSAFEVYQNLAEWLRKQGDSFARNLSVGLVDERYGSVGHPDSSEEQIKKTGFYDLVKEKGGRIISVLTGGDPQQEADRYNALISQSLAETDEFWAVLGIGPDGHTAGILPQKSPVEFEKIFPGDRWIVYYELPMNHSNPFKKRITLTPQGLGQIDLAVVVARSQGKEEALKRTFSPSEPFYRTPAVLLRQLNGILFTDTTKKV